MHRTTLLIPEDLKLRAVERAKSDNMSFGEFVRRALEKSLQDTDSDPFWNDKAVFRGEVPSDYSENHDDYLYGESH